ncbi:MAG TPA: glycosyltransferase [Bacteroidetes bacterium]|nr:glycosyltransferase [Bacteroidota bacterium]
MKSAKHIVILTPGFASDAEDFLCIPPLQAFLPRFRELYPDCRVSIIALQYPFQRGKYVWDGFEVIALGGRNKRSRKWLTWRRARKAFAELHAVHPVDIIHSLWMQECAWLGHWLGMAHGVAQVATIMGQDAIASNRYLRRTDLSKMKIVAISEPAAAHFARATGRQADAVIPWGLSLDEVAWLPESKGRSIDLLGVGSLLPVKKWERFLRVVALLADQHGPVRAVLVGEGPDRAMLEAKVKDLGLEDLVEFRGLLPRPEVLALMRQSKILLHTATYEGQGYVFLEALAQGMHVLSGPVGIARASSKWKICPDSITFADAATEFLETPVDEFPQVPYSIESTVEAMAKLYGADS